MARVYVSSTVSDLRRFRRAAFEVLAGAGHIHVGTEAFAASDQRPVELALATLDQCDLYVGIVAWQYGHIPPEHNPGGLSITELEYRHAIERHLPRLMFFVDEEAAWPKAFMDRDDTAVVAFRDRVQRDSVATRFYEESDFSSRLLDQLSSWALGTSGGAVHRPRVALVYAAHDSRLVDQIVSTSLGPLTGMDVDLISVTDSLPASTSHTLEAADVVVVAMSPDLLATGFGTSPEWTSLVERSDAGRARTLLVLLRPTSLGRTPVADRVFSRVPASGRALNEETNRDAVLVEIATAVQAAVRDVQARQNRISRRDVPVRQTNRLIDVFKQSGIPSITFVEPDGFGTLRRELETPGRGVVIEGPSGVGKTTALQTAIKQLDPTGQRAFEILRARNPHHVARIRALPYEHTGPVAIDDFHALDLAVRIAIVDYLKLLADEEPVDRKLVIVGIPGTGQRLVEMRFDIATRISRLHLGWSSDAKILEMIERGEAALNVDFVHKSEICRAAAGSLNIAQMLCLYAADLAGVRETGTSLIPVETDVLRTTARVMDVVEGKFDGLVQAFAALDGADSRTCIDLLLELGRAQDGVLMLRDLRVRRPELKRGIDRLLDHEMIVRHVDVNPGMSLHMVYDDHAATLVLDDPQLAFYLRQLNPERLASAVGKKPVRRRTQVFVSYSHADVIWLKRLRTHLAPLDQRGVIDPWEDSRIKPGAIWRDEIEEALGSAGVAVLLTSPEFLASPFIQDNELPPLLAAAENGGCQLLLLPVKPSLLADSPGLSDYQALLSPDTPLSGMTPAKRDAALVEVARTIADLVRAEQP